VVDIEEGRWHASMISTPLIMNQSIYLHDDLSCICKEACEPV